MISINISIGRITAIRLMMLSELDALLEVGACLSTNLKSTARVAHRAQPIYLPPPLKPHMQAGRDVVRLLLRRAGMTDKQLDDPVGLAFPVWGNEMVPHEARVVQDFSEKLTGYRFSSTNYRAMQVFLYFILSNHSLQVFLYSCLLNPHLTH